MIKLYAEEIERENRVIYVPAEAPAAVQEARGGGTRRACGDVSYNKALSMMGSDMIPCV